jgi:hypothetical protein
VGRDGGQLRIEAFVFAELGGGNSRLRGIGNTADLLEHGDLELRGFPEL